MPSSFESRGASRHRTDNGELISTYDEYREKVRSAMVDAYKGTAAATVSQHLDELHSIYRKVQTESNRDTRVQQADSRSFLDTSTLAAINAKNIKLQDLGMAIDQNDFLQTMKQFLGVEPGAESTQPDDDPSTTEERFNGFNWFKLGLLAYKVTSKTIPMDFLHGPFGVERRTRTLRARAINDISNGASTTAQQLDASELNNGEDQSTSHLVRKIFSIYDQKKEAEPVNFFKFFIDPWSFSQSVENLFFTSFLIKDGKLKLFLQDDIPMIAKPSAQETREVHQAGTEETKHHIAGFTYEVWEALKTTFNITEAYLGHREDQEDTVDLDTADDDEMQSIHTDHPAPSDSDSEDEIVGSRRKRRHL